MAAPLIRDEASSDVPLLSQKHSGIPAILLDKARIVKKETFEVRTKQLNERRRLPVIPQGIEENKFFEALEDLRGQLDPNTHDMMTVLDEEEFIASAIVYPGSTEEVQKIVLWANKYLVPLFPISMGRNLGYGGAAPRVRGSVTVDLGRRMSRILDINPDDYTCLVEPGVSFYAMWEALQSRGYDHMWIDTPDLGGGSIIGNTIDRGVGYTPYGDHWACHSGMEVVLPTGEVIRTGMGALPGSNTWQAFPYGFGPFSDGIFSQSNFGIVTKMGMTLVPNPGGHESFMYTFQKEEDLAQLVEIIRPLRISMILENVAQLRHITLTIASRGKPRTNYYRDDEQKSTPIPPEVVHKAAAETPVGDCTWLYYGMSYGPPQIRKYKLDMIDAEFHKVPGCKRIDPSTLPPDEYFWVRDRVAVGVPDVQELGWVNWVPNGSHIAFSPVSPIRGRDALALYDLAKKRHVEFGIDLFPAFIVGLREMHLIVEIVYDSGNAERRRAALKCLRAMVQDAAALGYGEYRTHLALMDQVAATYSWGDGALMKFNEKLKDTLDPNGILAPGRSGIWPARYRGRGWEMMGQNDETSEGQGVGVGTVRNE
ncbi:FAD-linked oxidase-like protein [Cryphonectria parasitica EP155]|uniref:FAD-linked oxidase-like protein n=1 Tax=Cryphonectria parasitica (strain ATCC 38755 / EP155) TaxID=660469 RepID=A0A9P4XXX1_CRYP1|nr:FAD-linked oxidase-like protein [Cryphonectria parasitica EP155]KAF3762805.1 FAD-linked oxidase-like protein [Cryphonectria parasitica EP155]